MVNPPPWAGGENTTEYPTAQGFFTREASFWKKYGETASQKDFRHRQLGLQKVINRANFLP